MTSDRPYRTALPTEEAVAELRRHAGTQFDSECVAALGRALGHRAPAPAHAGEREVEASVS